MPTRHISKNGQGKITSKVTKPKDWAFRTPSEGRPKSVHSQRVKQVKMEHALWSKEKVGEWLLMNSAGWHTCEWQISCENPARMLTASDVLGIFYADSRIMIETKINRELKIMIFVDLSDILTGGHEDSDSIPPQLTKAEIEVAKRPVHVLQEVYPCKKCGKYGPCKCGPKFNKCNGFTSWELICALAGISIFVLWTLVAVHFIHKFW